MPAAGLLYGTATRRRNRVVGEPLQQAPGETPGCATAKYAGDQAGRQIERAADRFGGTADESGGEG